MKPTSVRERRKFDETFKLEAVQNWLRSGKSAAVVGEELGINDNLLYAWRKLLPGVNCLIAPLSFLGAPYVNICWILPTNNIYQLQFTTDLSADAWSDLGCPEQGPATNWIMQSTSASTQRFYRVVLRR